MRRLDEFVSAGRPFFVDEVDYEAAAVDKHLRASGTRDHLVALEQSFAALPDFDVVSTEAALRQVAAERGIKAGTLIHAVRVAVTGRTASPGLFEVLSLVGRERTHARLAHAISLAL